MIWPFSRKQPAAPSLPAVPSKQPAAPSKQPAAPPEPPRYPAGYVADPERADIFDPALKHVLNGFVKGPPRDDAQAAALAIARSELLHLSLLALAESPLRDQVVLRGSLTLESWFPERARRARDLDLVVRDPACEPEGPRAAALLDEVGRAVTAAMAAVEVPVLTTPIPVDKIWTYERAEGRRLSVPWRFRDSLVDALTIDIVFHEPLQDAPQLEQMSRATEARGYRDSGKAPSLWLASRAESLAWKLLWLETDRYPQGKDLYDAVLLAEDTALPFELVKRVYAGKKERWQHESSADFVRELEMDWEAFALADPELAGDDPSTLVTRLEAALRFV